MSATGFPSTQALQGGAPLIATLGVRLALFPDGAEESLHCILESWFGTAYEALAVPLSDVAPPVQYNFGALMV